MKVNTPRPVHIEEVPEVDLQDPDFSVADEEDGLVAPMIDDDPEHDRLVDPED